MRRSLASFVVVASALGLQAESAQAQQDCRMVGKSTEERKAIAAACGTTAPGAKSPAQPGPRSRREYIQQQQQASAAAATEVAPVDYLLALDALYLTEDEQAIGAAPFCPVETDIKVSFPHETLYALSALDALALPRLLGSAGVIETRCPVSRQPITLQIDAQGNPLPAELDKAMVVFQKISEHVQHYSHDIAGGIRFVHPALRGRFPQSLTLAEAAATVHAFYAFQRRMLAGTF